MNKNNKNEIRLLIEHWKETISEENIVFEEVLKILLEEEEYLNEISGSKKAIFIASLLTSLFVMSPKVTNANPTSFNKFTTSMQQKVCDGGGSGQCSIDIKPKSSLSKIQQAIRMLGIDLEISEIDGMSSSDAVSFIEDKINNNIDRIENALKSENSKIMAGVEDDVSNMNIKQLIKAYNNSPGADMFKPVIKLINVSN